MQTLLVLNIFRAEIMYGGLKVPPWLDHPAKYSALLTRLVMYSNAHYDLMTSMLHIILYSSRKYITSILRFLNERSTVIQR